MVGTGGTVRPRPPEAQQTTIRWNERSAAAPALSRVSTKTPSGIPAREAAPISPAGGVSAPGLPRVATYVHCVTSWLNTISYVPVPRCVDEVVPCERASVPFVFTTAVSFVIEPAGPDGPDGPVAPVGPGAPADPGGPAGPTGPRRITPVARSIPLTVWFLITLELTATVLSWPLPISWTAA